MQEAIAKPCVKCGGSGPFAKDKRSTSGLTSDCLACRRLVNAAYRQAHPEKCAAYSKKYQTSEKGKKVQEAWRGRNRPRLNEWSKEWQKANPRLRQSSRLKSRYGIELADFERMWTEQDGRCAVCSKDLVKGRNTHVDHDHGTGAVRGLLCSGCNTGLGGMRDDTRILQGAIAYLEKHNAQRLS